MVPVTPIPCLRWQISYFLDVTEASSCQVFLHIEVSCRYFCRLQLGGGDEETTTPGPKIIFFVAGHLEGSQKERRLIQSHFHYAVENGNYLQNGVHEYCESNQRFMPERRIEGLDISKSGLCSPTHRDEAAMSGGHGPASRVLHAPSVGLGSRVDWHCLPWGVSWRHGGRLSRAFPCPSSNC